MKKNYPFFMHIVGALMLITVGISGVLFATSTKTFKEFFLHQQEEKLAISATLFASELLTIPPEKMATDLVDSLAKVAGGRTDTRFTVITREGEVLVDNKENPQAMDNHASRPEVAEALSTGQGVSLRYSSTLKNNQLYVAILQEPFVIRAATSTKSMDTLIAEYTHNSLRTLFISLLVATLLGAFVARRISKPLENLTDRAAKLAKGDFAPHPPIQGSREVIALATTIENTSKELAHRFGQLQRQRERLRAVLSAMAEGVIAFDEEEKIFLINDTAATLFGLNQEEVLGAWVQEAIRSVPLQQLVRSLLSREDHEPAHISKEITITVQNEPRRIAVRGTVLANQKGCLIVFQDITDIKRLENLRRDFAGNVSHELRTPLTAIKGFVETLEDGALADPQAAHRFLGIIHEQVDRLNQLIEDLLTISRLENESEDGGVPFEMTPLLPLINRLCTQKQEDGAAEGKTLHVSCPKSAIAAYINESLFEQALLNLIENALKYSPLGATIKVQVREDEKYLYLEVIDNGPGIAPEHHARLFERFYRVDRGRNRAQGGTGLGLSIVKHIVGLHNGSLSLTSEVGEGSTFTITLPKRLSKENC